MPKLKGPKKLTREPYTMSDTRFKHLISIAPSNDNATYLASGTLQRSRHENVRLYDGSFVDWVGRRLPLG